MTFYPDWQVLPQSQSGLGESPFWHPYEHMLYWVDIPGCKILRSNVFMGTTEVWPLAQNPGFIAPASQGGLVIALRDGLYRARTWDGLLELLEPASHDTSRMRFNDGKCDSVGRLWAGTMVEPQDQNAAELLCLDRRPYQRPGYSSKVGDAIIANGLAWSPDSRTMYWADTPTHRVWAWDFDVQTAQLSERRVFHTFAEKPFGWEPLADPLLASAYAGRPDGAAVDSAGNYWVAMFEGQRIVKLSPSGSVIAEYATPALCTTMPCFGGADGRTLYITTARVNRGAGELALQPDAGCVFFTQLAASESPGLPVNFYSD